MKNILQRILLLISILIGLGSSIYAGENNISQNTINQIKKDFSYEYFKDHHGSDKVLSENNIIRMKLIDENRFYVILLAIMFLVSLITTLLLSSSSRTSRDIVTISGLNLVVFGSMISVLIVDTTEALGAIMGILGSMGGYLFGSWDKREKE